MKLVNVKLADLDRGDGPIDEGVVARLAESIAAVGLQQPVGVRPVGAGWRLIYGRHRLAAIDTFEPKWATCPAVVFDVDEAQAEMAAIDENLVRRVLNEMEEDAALARRKELYLALHPETKAGVAGGSAPKTKGGETSDTVSFVPPTPPTASFVKDTARKTGKSRRTIERKVAIGESIPPQIQELLSHSPAAGKQADLKKIAAMDAARQLAVATLLNDGSAASVAKAEKLVDAPPKPADGAPDIDGLAAPYHTAVKQLTTMKATFKRLAAEQRTGAHLSEVGNAIERQIRDLRGTIGQATPTLVCPRCSGKGCKACAESGFWTRAIEERVKKGE